MLSGRRVLCIGEWPAEGKVGAGAEGGGRGPGAFSRALPAARERGCMSKLTVVALAGLTGSRAQLRRLATSAQMQNAAAALLL